MKHLTKIYYLLGLSILFFSASPSNAFIYIRGGKYEKGARPVSMAPYWLNRTLSFKVNLNLSAYNGSETLKVSPAEFLRATEIAIGTWSDACRSDLKVELNGETNLISDGADGESVISYDNRSTATNAFGTDQNILAAATTVLENNLFYDCDILVNGNATASFGVEGNLTGKYDLASVLAHEIGHCLGLDHPVEPPAFDIAGTPSEKANSFFYNSTMVQSAIFGTGDSRRRTLNQDDKDGVDCIYEKGSPIREGSRCSSYHGTNNNGELTGIISGGPTVDLGNVCGSVSQARTILGNEEDHSSSGCIGSATAEINSIKSHSKLNNKKLNHHSFFNFLLNFFFLGSTLLFYFFKNRLKRPSHVSN